MITTFTDEHWAKVERSISEQATLRKVELVTIAGELQEEADQLALELPGITKNRTERVAALNAQRAKLQEANAATDEANAYGQRIEDVHAIYRDRWDTLADEALLDADLEKIAGAKVTAGRAALRSMIAETMGVEEADAEAALASLEG